MVNVWAIQAYHTNQTVYRTGKIYCPLGMRYPIKLAIRVSVMNIRIYPRILNNFKEYLPPNLKWNLCNTLVLSHIHYCRVVYFNFLTGELRNRIQVLQNCCFRYSYSISRFEHITPHYVKKNVLKLEFRYTLLFAAFVYNIVKSRLPGYLSDLLVLRSDIHDVNLRNCTHLTIPKYDLTKDEGCFAYNVAKMFNEY